MKKVDDREAGETVESGWIEGLLNEQAYRVQQEIETRQRSLWALTSSRKVTNSRPQVLPVDPQSEPSRLNSCSSARKKDSAR